MTPSVHSLGRPVHGVPMTRLAQALTAALLSSLLLAPAQAATDDEEFALDAVAISARVDDLGRRQEAPATRIVYGREQLAKTSEATVGDYLRKLPGVTFSGPPGAPKDVRMRGMDKGYTQILIDGERVPGGGKERQIQVDRLPLDLVERIEVIRAPSADMPNEGIAGTINIVLRDQPDQPLANARVYAGVNHDDVDNGYPLGVSGQWSDRNGKFGYLLSGSAARNDLIKTKTKDEQKYDVASGAVKERKGEFEDERTGVKEYEFAPRLSWELSDTDQLKLSPFWSRSDEQKEKAIAITKYDNPADNGGTAVANGSKQEDEDKVRDILRLKGDWSHQREGGNKWQTKLNLQAAQEQKDKVTEEFDNKGALKKTALEDGESREKGVEIGTKVSRKVKDHKLSAGAEFSHNNRDDEKIKTENGSPKPDSEGDNFDITERRYILWLQDEWRLATLHTLTPGLRGQLIDTQSTDGLGEEHEGETTALSPSLHYLWQLSTRDNIRSSLTHSLKPPKFDDLSSVVRSGDGSYSDPDKVGNPDLEPEQAWAYELGWERYFLNEAGVLGLNLFYRDIDDLIEKRISEGDDGRYVESPENVGSANIWGAELDLQWRQDWLSLPALTLRGNYSRFDSELDADDGSSRKVKDIPPYVFNLGFDYVVEGWALEFGSSYNVTPGYIKDPAKNEWESSQRLLDLYIAKTLSRDLKLRLTASNLLDMAKDKDKPVYNADGALTQRTLEHEEGAVAVVLALEGRW